MARKRWQNGSILVRGKHVKTVVGRFLEDEVQPDGTLVRRHRSEVLGTLEELPTLRLQKRALAQRLTEVNSASYTPKHRITIKQASEQYLKHVCPAFKLASQASVKSNMKIIVGHFGGLPVSELSLTRVQAWVTSLDKSPKTVSNYITTFQMLWKHCRASGYVTHNPFEFLTLPRAELREPASFSPEQIREIIERAGEPYSLMFWICAETGCRGGELCGLYRDDIDIENRMIYVRRSAFQGQLQTPKTSNAVRAFPISQALCDHIRAVLAHGGQTNITCPSNLHTENVHREGYEEADRQALYLESRQRAGQMSALRRNGQRSGAGKGSSPDNLPAIQSPLLFITPRGCPYDNGNIVKRGLKPILRAMGIDSPRTGLHALRHSNRSALDSIGAPMSVCQDRLGHASAKMSLHYAHSFSNDHRRVADEIGVLFRPRQDSSPKPLESGGFVTSSAGESTDNRMLAGGITGKPEIADRPNHLPADSHTETVQEPELAMAGD